MTNPTAYQTVEKHFRRLSRLSHARSILGWDEAVMMPQGGSEVRAQAVSELVVMSAEIFRNTELNEALKIAQNEKDLSLWQQANLREAKQTHARMMAVDPALMEKQVQTAMACEQAWRKMRAANDWSGFSPKLSAVVELAREESRQRSAATGLPVYDAMVDLYEPGLRVATIERVFNELRENLPGLIGRVIEHQKKDKLVDLNRPVPAAKQKIMMTDFMKWLGFNFENGRLDESHHPFCGGVPRDVRMTTRYSESDFLPGLMGVLHETGHAMYEQGLPAEWGEQPVGNARGMAFHESQSLFVEMQVSRSREFVRFAAPILRKHLAESSDPEGFWTEDNLVNQITRVEKGFIRVDADEVTYPAHVILRFEIERGLIEGSLQVKDLPGIWNEKMQQYLGLSTIGNDKDGCMQDVHWPSGAFGYFPSYSLGALTAAQLMQTLLKQNPEARTGIARGEIKPVMDWLRANVWSKGSSLSSEDLMTEITGAPLGVEAFLNHVRKRYLGTA